MRTGDQAVLIEIIDLHHGLISVSNRSPESGVRVANHLPTASMTRNMV
jgi:hypothetical protein